MAANRRARSLSPTPRRSETACSVTTTLTVGRVGLAAVEIAKLLGATVIAAASSDERLTLCRDRGANHPVNYDITDLHDAIKAIEPDGADELLEHLAAGRLVPQVSAVYPLERVAEALNEVAGRRSTGKVLLAP